MNRKGQVFIQEIPVTFIFLTVIAVFGVAAYLVLAGLGDSTNDSAASGAINNVTGTLDNIVGYTPIWGTIIGVAALIGIVIAAFVFSRKGDAL